MRNITTYLFIITLNFAFSQNKKEQLEIISKSKDSLESVSSKLTLSLYESNNKIQFLNDQNSHLQTQIDSLKSENNNSIKNEINKWKKELLLNGEVGPPCIEDYEIWIDENPNYYWGLTESVSSQFDFNNDGINDCIASFPAVNCVGGNGIQSDFAILIYSNNTDLLTNKNVVRNIEEKIVDFFNREGIYNVSFSKIEFKGLNSNLLGNFYLWTDQDPNCCPSYSGTFKYSPVTFKIEVIYWQNED